MNPRDAGVSSNLLASSQLEGGISGVLNSPFQSPRTCPIETIILLREYILLPIWKFVRIELVCAVFLFVGFILAADYVMTPWFILGFLMIKMLLVLYSVCRWQASYYQITPEKVIYHKGVFSRHQEVFALKNIESIDLTQSCFGKLFHFGTLKLYAPTLNHRVFILNIHNPRKRMKLIEELLPKTHMENFHEQDMMILPSTTMT